MATHFHGTITSEGYQGPLLDANGNLVAAITNLTNNSGGAVSNTIPAIGATYVQADVANAIASLTAKVNALNAALKAAQVTK